MKTIRRTLALAVVALLLSAAGAVVAGPASQGSTDWPQWRGPNRDGVAASSPKLLDAWPKEGPPRVWKSEYIPSFRVGGASSPVVADGKVFVYVSWYHPVGGGELFKPITTELLANWGWLDIPDELGKRIEEARVSPNRPKTGHFLDNWTMAPKKEQMDRVPKFLKEHPEMETYVKAFLATLAPADGEKYGDYIAWRLCVCQEGPGDSARSWDDLKVLKPIENKGYQTYAEYIKEQKPHSGEEYGCWTYAWEKATESMTDTLVCLDGATGKTIWKKDFPATKVSTGWGISPSSTPAIWNGKCYFVGIMGLYCLSATDGSLIWRSKEGGGCHTSVLVADGVVVGGWPLAAYDAETGKKLWYTGDYRAGGTPVLWRSGGKKYIITAASWGVIACCIDMATWKVVWDIKKGDMAQSTPVLVDDTLLFNGGVGGTCAYKITPEKAELLWKSPVVDGIESFVVYQDYIYMDISNHRQPELYCLSLKTGETKWCQKGFRGANIVSSPIVADGKIIMPSWSDGIHSPLSWQLIKPSPEKYIPLGSFNPEGAQCSSPAFAGGKLYLRLWDGVGCYDLRAEGK